MTFSDAMDRIDRRIAERTILEHPFYVAWRRGELDREQLAAYARLYYPHVAAFPGYLEAALADATDPAVRDELAANLAEERSVPKAHDELWLDFSRGLGLDPDAVAAARPTPGVERVVETFRRLSRRSTGAALAGLYAYESQQPEVARQKADDLRELYGVDDPETLAYFEVHAEADLRHREGERAALERCVESGADPAELLAATDEALDAYWGLLDEVCRETGVAAAA